MFAVISTFTVDNTNDMTAAVKAAYIARPHLVDGAAGFVRLDVLSPLDKPDEIWLLTYWTDEASFHDWHRTHRYQEAHAAIPAGLKLLDKPPRPRFFEHVSS